MRSVVIIISIISICGNNYQESFAQCCSGASPIAGGLAQGVLQKKQIEFSTNYQYLYSDFALTGAAKTAFPVIEKAFASYLYFRLAYGVTKKITLSIESGYHLNKTEQLIAGSQIVGKGVGDLIIFPKYDLFNKTTPKHQTEIAIGLGAKLPLGEYNQRYVAYVNKANDTTWIKKSPGIQPSSGTKDLVFYAFFYRGYTKSQLLFYTAFTHILRGTNPDGVDFGNITSLTLSASKSILPYLNLGLGLKGEKLDTIFDPVYLTTKYSSGGKKISIIPQIFYTLQQKLTFSLVTDIPIYQFVNGTQIASKYLFNFGVIYRFEPFKKKDVK